MPDIAMRSVFEGSLCTNESSIESRGQMAVASAGGLIACNKSPPMGGKLGLEGDLIELSW
jgi:hypothetical protein